RTAAQVSKPEAPCLGSVNEPFAESTALGGNLCVYRGGGGIGRKETEDLNVTSAKPFFEDFLGEVITETGEGNSGDLGVDVVFRTAEFNAAGGAPTALAKLAYMAAKGSWAVR